MMTVQHLQYQSRQLLQSDEAALEIDTLLAHVLGKNRTFLRTWPEHVLSDAQFDHYHQLLQQRLEGTPLAYILEVRDFWRLSLQVNSKVLIPRPDTECVVEAVLKLGEGQQWRVADLGTGSGAIALSLAVEHPEWDITATDLSADSLAIAQQNAAKHQITNVSFLQGSWFEPLTGKFHCIVSNPPYIAADDPHLSDLQHEPQHALVAADNGFADLTHLAFLSNDFLHENGWLVLEHGFEQGEAVRTLLTEAGFQRVTTEYDYGGNPRYSYGQKPC
jgi:release factor glutamine methyltransferase